MLSRLTPIALTLALALPTIAHAARIEDRATFDVVIRGISAATLSFAGVQDGNRYSVSGVLKSAGLAALVRKVSYNAKVNGSVSNGRYVPSAYSEISDTGKKKSQSKMTYRRGVPREVEYSPPREARENAVDPAKQGGTLDTLTALYAILRDVDAGQECKVDVKMYDGRYVSQIGLAKPQKQGSDVVCNGEYRRLDGFKPEDMAERTRFPFTVTYQPMGNGKMRVAEVAMESIYGKAAMKRR